MGRPRVDDGGIWTKPSTKGDFVWGICISLDVFGMCLHLYMIIPSRCCLIYIYIYIYIYIHIYIHMCVCVCVCEMRYICNIYVYIHTYILHIYNMYTVYVYSIIQYMQDYLPILLPV